MTVLIRRTANRSPLNITIPVPAALSTKEATMKVETRKLVEEWDIPKPTKTGECRRSCPKHFFCNRRKEVYVERRDGYSYIKFLPGPGCVWGKEEEK